MTFLLSPQTMTLQSLSFVKRCRQPENIGNKVCGNASDNSLVKSLHSSSGFCNICGTAQLLKL